MCEAADTYINDDIIQNNTILSNNSFQETISALNKLYLRPDSDADHTGSSSIDQEEFNEDIYFQGVCSPVLLDNEYSMKYTYSYNSTFSFCIFYLQDL